MSKTNYSVLVSDRLPKVWGFIIEDGPFKDVLVSVNGFNSDPLHEGSMSVDYYIVNKPDNVSNDMLKSKEFEKLFEVIVNDVLKGVLVDSAGNEDFEASGS